VTLLPANDASLNEEVGFPGDNLINSFFVRMLVWQLFSSYMYITCTWKNLPEQRWYKKCAHIKLMKLTAGDNFIIILQALLSLKSFCQKVTKPNWN
jgi:hypothetical protein